LGIDFPAMRWIASVDDGETVRQPVSVGLNLDPAKLVLTFDGLLQRSEFVSLLKKVLTHLKEHYQLPVDIEFTISFTPGTGKPGVIFHLLQCRPQVRWSSDGNPLQPLPRDLPEPDKIFLCTRMAPQGHVSEIEYVVYVDPEKYHQLSRPQDYTDVARCIGQLNKALEGHTFMMLGPGRWGSSDAMQGVPVTYADIFNSKVLIELASKKGGYSSEPSYGTHFFQDLVETQIYPLAISAEEPGDYLNMDFIREADDHSPEFFAEASEASRCIKVIHVASERKGWHLEVAMDGQQGLGYLVKSRHGE